MFTAPKRPATLLPASGRWLVYPAPVAARVGIRQIEPEAVRHEWLVRRTYESRKHRTVSIERAVRTFAEKTGR